jgi:hypothetical protein
MSLANLKVPTETFQIGEESLTIRGLGSSDLAYLIQKHQDKIGKLSEAFKTAQDEQMDMAELVVKLSGSLPDLMASIVACGANERGGEANVEKIPFPVAIRIIKAIGRLTFAEYGGVKPFFEDIVSIAQSATDSITTLTE